MKHQKAQSLIELLIALGVFVLVVTAINFLSLDTYIADRAGGERTQATFLAKEGIEAAISISDNNWEDLILGEHGLTISDGNWVFQGTEDDFSDQLTQGRRVITIEEDANCNTNCRKITSEVTWQLTSARPQTVTLVTYSTNLVSHNWLQTLLTDFNLGKRNSVQTTETGDGEVKLSLVGDWNDASVLTNFNADANGDIRDIFIDNNIAYVITMNNGGSGEKEFFVLDISDNSNENITLLGSTELGTELGDDARSIYVSGNYAYIASDANNAELMVVRLTDYTLINQYDVPVNVNGLNVFVVDDIAYLVTNVNNQEEFYALDVSNPEGEITQLGSLEIGATINEMDISDGYAYLATEGNNKELTVVRLTDITEVNTFDIAGNGDMTSIQIVGDIAYMGRESSGEAEFYALDITDPEGIITEINSIDLGGDDVETIFIYGDSAYVGTDNADKEVIIIDLNTYTESGFIDLTGSNYVYTIVAHGAHIYIGTTNNDYEIEILRGAQGGWINPQITGTANIIGDDDANDVVVSGNYAYVVTEEDFGTDPEFLIFNISDPANPDLRGLLDLGDDINSVFVSGNYAYITTDDNDEELMVINITNKDNPNKVDFFDTPGDDNAYDVFVSGDYAYVVTHKDKNDSEFFIIDVSDPENLPKTQVGDLELNADAFAVYVSGNYAYVATGNDDQELIVVDITDPLNLSIDGTYNTDDNDDATDIFVNSNTAYLTTKVNSSSGINPEFYILDVGTPANPSLMGHLNLNTNINKVSVSDNYAYLATDEDNAEFQIIDITILANPVVYGTLALDGDAKGIDFDGDYVYLATKHNSLELQIVGSSELPNNYSQWGIFTSSVYDTGQADTSWNNIFWIESGNGALKFQFRTANTEANLSSAIWVGSDGTINTYYTVLSQAIITDPGATGTQWAQYRTFFTGDGSTTPVLEDIILYYSE
ncbi:hypothetical protein KKG58_03025 [Patescibacteria group bacterium]|nr:hypothetical protein [Patescibacteria group bacterium]